jgi:uncharacterized membrane-anchored protein YhcB (DUF1043 family)
MHNYYTIISLLSGSLGGGIIYRLLENSLTEKIKLQIKHEYDLKFENAKKELEKKATRFQIQYSKLHLDRSEILKELYSKLIDAEDCLKNLVSTGQGPEWSQNTKKEENANNVIRDIKIFILKNRIYFDAPFCEKLEKLILEYEDVILNIDESKMIKNFEKSGLHTNESYFDKWIQQRDRMNIEITDIRVSLELEFRKLLGV